MADLKRTFRKVITGSEETGFERYLRDKFDVETQAAVLQVFEQLGLPAPESRKQFLAGTEGGLVFVNRYGVVVRIERAETMDSPSGYSSERVDNSPWVVAPLGAVKAGLAIVEICPGCHCSNDGKDLAYLRRRLKSEGVDFWDYNIKNIGLAPMGHPRFPEGVPVLIDRLAVKRLTKAVKPLGRNLAKERREVEALEKELYGPLKRSFKQGWMKKDMRSFWQLCEIYTQQGRLVAGWNGISSLVVDHKRIKAAGTGLAYQSRLKV